MLLASGPLPWLAIGYCALPLLLWLFRLRGMRSLWIPLNRVAFASGIALLASAWAWPAGFWAGLFGLLLTVTAAWVAFQLAPLVVAFAAAVAAAVYWAADWTQTLSFIIAMIGLVITMLYSRRKMPLLADLSHFQTTFGPLEIQILSYGLKRPIALGLARRRFRNS